MTYFDHFFRTNGVLDGVQTRQQSFSKLSEMIGPGKEFLPSRCPLFVQSFRPDQTEKIGMRDVKGGLRGVPGDQGRSGGSRGVQGILGDRGGRQWPPPLLQSCKAFKRGGSIPVWTKQQRFRPSQDPSSRGSARVQDKSTYHIIFCNKQLIFVKKKPTKKTIENSIIIT